MYVLYRVMLRLSPLVCVCVCTDNVATLFRASTLATMLMDQLMKLTAMDYLHSVLKESVERIAELKDCCEVQCICYHVDQH